MEQVKKTKDYIIYKKRSERFAIKDTDGKWINGDKKAKILIKEKLVTAAMPKPTPAPEAEEATEAKEEGKEVKAEETKPEEKTEEAATAKDEPAAKEAKAEETPAKEAPTPEKAVEEKAEEAAKEEKPAE